MASRRRASSCPPRRAPGLDSTCIRTPVFILLRGQVRFRVGDETVEAHADQIVIGPANVPHGFTNMGTEPLSMFSIHVNDHLIQEFLQDEPASLDPASLHDRLEHI